MATHSIVLAWRIPGTGEPGGLPSLGSHRVGHNWSDLAAYNLGKKVLSSNLSAFLQRQSFSSFCFCFFKLVLLAFIAIYLNNLFLLFSAWVFNSFGDLVFSGFCVVIFLCSFPHFGREIYVCVCVCVSQYIPLFLYPQIGLKNKSLFSSFFTSILYSAILLSSFISFSNCFVDSLEFSIKNGYRIFR